MTDEPEKIRHITDREWRELVDILSQLNAGLIVINRTLFGEDPVSPDDEMGKFGRQFFEMHKELQVKIGRLVGIDGGDGNG